MYAIYQIMIITILSKLLPIPLFGREKGLKMLRFIIAANSRNEWVKPGTLPWTLLHLDPKRAGQVKSIAPGWAFANTVAGQTQINPLQEKPMIQEMKVEKRKGEIYFRDWQLVEMASSSLNS